MTFPLLQSLRSLTKDNLVQNQRVDSIEMLISNLVAFNDSVLLYPKLSYNKGQLVKRIKTNREFRIRIRKITDALNNEENRLLKTRQAAHNRNETDFNTTFYFLLILIGILLSTTFFAIRYTTATRKPIQDNIHRSHLRFQRCYLLNVERPIRVS
jgi:CHASE3 domain sensor protein